MPSRRDPATQRYCANTITGVTPKLTGENSKINREKTMIWYFSRGKLSYGIYIKEVGNPNLFQREVVSLAKLSPGSSPRWIQPGYWDRGQLVSYWWIFRVRICCLFVFLFVCFSSITIHFAICSGHSVAVPSIIWICFFLHSYITFLTYYCKQWRYFHKFYRYSFKSQCLLR